MEKLLKLLEQDARYTTEQLAAMADMTKADVEAAIAQAEKDGVILGYKALIDWEKTDKETVTALIEVKVTPQHERGFDEIAEQIYKHPEVQSVYLMSGGFDFTVIISGRTMKEVARFVSDRLAPMEGVLSTATHFVLVKYKDQGVEFCEKSRDERRVMSL